MWEKHWESSVNWQDDLQWKENDKNEESQETTKVSYSNEYFEVIVPESWEGEWTVTEEDNTMNGIKSTLYRFSHDPADGEEGGAADVYVLDMSDTSRPLSHYSRMLPSAGCEEVGLTSFGYNDVFKMEVGAPGATIGHTLSSQSIIQSIRTGFPHVNAFAKHSLNSFCVVARSPTAPIASASFT